MTMTMTTARRVSVPPCPPLSLSHTEAVCDGARDRASTFNLNISSELSLEGATATDNKTASQIAEFLRNAADNDEVQAVFACVTADGGEAFTEAVIEAKQDFQIVAVVGQGRAGHSSQPARGPQHAQVGVCLSVCVIVRTSSRLCQ